MWHVDALFMWHGDALFATFLCGMGTLCLPHFCGMGTLCLPHFWEAPPAPIRQGHGKDLNLRLSNHIGPSFRRFRPPGLFYILPSLEFMVPPITLYITNQFSK